MKTLVGAAEPPERPRNESIRWTTGTTNTAVTAGWVRLDVKR